MGSWKMEDGSFYNAENQEPGTCFRYSLFLILGCGGGAAATQYQKRAQTCRSIRAKDQSKISTFVEC
ncbi:hypothetical protein [Chryseobacterium wanjuense]